MSLHSNHKYQLGQTVWWDRVGEEVKIQSLSPFHGARYHIVRPNSRTSFNVPEDELHIISGGLTIKP